MATPLFIPNYINRCIYYKHKNTYFIPTIRFTCRKSRQTYENRSLLQPIILQDARMRAYDVTAYRAADWLTSFRYLPPRWSPNRPPGDSSKHAVMGGGRFYYRRAV